MQSSPGEPHVESEAHAGPQGCRVVCHHPERPRLQPENGEEEGTSCPQAGGGSTPKEGDSGAPSPRAFLPPWGQGKQPAQRRGSTQLAGAFIPDMLRAVGTGLGHSAVRHCPVKGPWIAGQKGALG